MLRVGVSGILVFYSRMATMEKKNDNKMAAKTLVAFIFLLNVY